MKRNIQLGLIAAVVFQFLVLVGMYVSAQVPLWTGSEIRLKTVPVDPRSMFRGNYARLRYDISQLPEAMFAQEDGVQPGELRQGEVVYVSLKPGKSGLYELAGASLKKPGEGIFLRGRIAGDWFRDSVNYYRIEYGIEAFFAPKEKALQLERELADGGVALVMVSGSGKARLKDVSGPEEKN